MPPPLAESAFYCGGQETAVSGVCSGPGFAFPAGAWVCPKVDVEVVPNARVVVAAEARGACPAYVGTGYSGPGVPAMLLRMRASPLRVSGVVPIRASNSASSIASHASASHRQRVEHGVEGRVGVHRGLLVVGATTLAAVAAEDPAIEADSFGGLFLDRVAGDTASRVVTFGRRWRPSAAFDAIVAASAARPFERRVVDVGIVREQQFAQQDIGAETGCHQQRLAAYPAQPGLDGQLFSSSGAVSTNARPDRSGREARSASSIRPSIPLIVVW